MEEQLKQLVQGEVLKNLKHEENKIDAELSRLNNMDDDEMEKLREKRLRAMKAQAIQRNEWKQKGHGEYSEIVDQHQFFETTKRSKHTVIHFYSPTNAYGPIVDKHLKSLASKHLETKFAKINAEKCEFLVRKLNVWMMPTILLTQDREVLHAISGFDELGGTKDFSTNFLEYVLGQWKVLKYDGPPPESVTEDRHETDRLNLNRNTKSSVRQGFYDSCSDDDDE